ncbi:BspA family leucine-rich repeat surface protein, partial [Leeuwenhoekiella palythoae]|uniref:BspA family leucine-rich repeat surface protein n=1 Tax=Leeuwenhoekiella palythoae TaxID=573501 RepID=UPI003514D4E8
MKHNYLSTRILWVFLLIIFTTPIALGQSFTENFSQTGPDLVTSFSRNYSGVQFDYLFTSDGDGGDFVHNESGGNLNILSADLNDATTERVTIQRNDGNSFVFNSIYIDNIGGNNPSHNVVVTGKFNGSTVSSQVMNFGNIGTLNFGSGSGIIVDLIEITAGGFEPILVDDFTGAVSVSNTAPTAASFTTANGPFEDFGYVFTTAAFGYTDSDSDPLAYLLIESLPTVGRLYLDTNNNDAYNGGEEVYANQQISRADLDAGNLQYVQNGSTNTSFQFEVSDGTATSTGNYIATLAVIPKPSVSLAVSPTTVSENGGSATLTATLSNSYGRDVEVNLVNYGTATSSGIDFNFSRSITIPAGNTSGTGTINIQEDRLDEEDETIIIAINTTVNSYENGNQEVTVTILDNDEPPLVSINSVSSSESAGLLTFTVSLSAQSQKRITVDYATADQTALALSDYISQSGTITFSPGETSKTITVQLLDDDIFENDEQFFIDLFGTTNADVIPTRRGVGTILNDDSRPNISSVAVPTDKTYQLGGTLDFTVNFSENVTVNTMGGTPQLDFLLGSETKAASYLSGSGTSALVFRYTVALNDYDADGISINTLATNGSTIQNASGTDAALGLKSVGDTSGVLVDARDGDGDGTPDSSDACPTDPNKINPGACGCGVPDSDTDSDGVPDCLDACPIDPNKTNPGACGCGIADVDSDGDGLADCIDPDPLDPSDSEAFVTTWRITMPNESITIPTEGGGYNYSVAWGDGETNAGLTGDATHTYAAAGTYKVSIRGDFPRIFFNNTGTSKDKIIEINQWGTQVWTRFDSAFNGCTNLTIENASDIPQFSTNTSLYAMFANCINFNADLNDWDLSNVIETNFMFAYASSFKGEISDWNMANVTNIQSMFRGATAFNQPIGTWNVGQVQLMDNLFNGAENFDQDLSNWNTGNVTTMRGMFFAARLFKSDIGNWNTEKVTDMSNMLRSANAFNQDIGSWDVSQVTDLSFMLFDTPLFNQDLGDWDVSAVTNAENMFAGSSLSLANYDALLTGWFTIDTGEAPLQTGVDFSAGSNQYCQAGAERQALINTYSWIITDGGVEDIAPTPDVITLADITAECSVTTLTPPTASDNCAATVTVTNDATLPITAQGTTVVTWTYDDGNGNVSTQTQNVIIEDVTDPVADVTTLADITAECEVTSLTAPTATDNCATTVTVTNNASLPITAQGTTVITWTYDDGNENVSTQTQNVIIDDVTAPVADVTTLADVTAECEVTSLTAPTATDNCATT